MPSKQKPIIGVGVGLAFAVWLGVTAWSGDAWKTSHPFFLRYFAAIVIIIAVLRLRQYWRRDEE